MKANPRLPLVPTMMVSITGSEIGWAAPQSTTKFAPVPPRTSSVGMKIETVAECVETADVRNRLTELGVDWAQGFLFGRPRPIDEVLAKSLDRPVEVWGRKSGR